MTSLMTGKSMRCCHRASPDSRSGVMANPELLDLARRPIMTEYILDALPDIEAGRPVDLPRVYLYAVRRKMERDIRSERAFTSLADKLYFLCELSWEMLSTDRAEFELSRFPYRLHRLFGRDGTGAERPGSLALRHDGANMLVRNDRGDYASSPSLAP